MNRAIPAMRKFAERLSVHEKPGNTKSPPPPPAFHVLEKLRPHLTKLLGSGGFRSILSRSLVLAGAEIPWLRAVHVKADGSLEGLRQLEAHVDGEMIAEGQVV